MSYSVGYSPSMYPASPYSAIPSPASGNYDASGLGGAGLGTGGFPELPGASGASNPMGGDGDVD